MIGFAPVRSSAGIDKWKREAAMTRSDEVFDRMKYFNEDSEDGGL